MQIGLTIGRFQPLTKGHTRIINTMVEDCDTVIVCVGSTQESNTINNPFNFDMRKQMLRNVYGDRVKIIPLTDLGTEQSSTAWCDYVLEKLRKLGLPKPTDYYSGSTTDAIWYQHEFGNRLHVLDRSHTVTISATEVRTWLRYNKDDWKQYVPQVNWNIVKDHFK